MNALAKAISLLTDENQGPGGDVSLAALMAIALAGIAWSVASSNRATALYFATIVVLSCLATLCILYVALGLMTESRTRRRDYRRTRPSW